MDRKEFFRRLYRGTQPVPRYDYFEMGFTGVMSFLGLVIAAWLMGWSTVVVLYPIYLVLIPTFGLASFMSGFNPGVKETC